jgi:hypothetical protein
MDPHVRAQDDRTGKPHEKVLTARIHPLDRPTTNREAVDNARDSGEHRFEVCHRAARKRGIQRASRTEDCVAFRHADARLVASG